MTRAPLFNRRKQVSFEFEHSSARFVASVGMYPDGKPGEFFLSCNKVGSAIEALARDGAILASLARQYGCPLETMRRALTRDEHGIPASPIGGLLDEVEG